MATGWLFNGSLGGCQSVGDCQGCAWVVMKYHKNATSTATNKTHGSQINALDRLGGWGVWLWLGFCGWLGVCGWWLLAMSLPSNLSRCHLKGYDAKRLWHQWYEQWPYQNDHINMMRCVARFICYSVTRYVTRFGLSGEQIFTIILYWVGKKFSWWTLITMLTRKVNTQNW